MPPIKICHKHALDHEQACDKVRQIADEMARKHGVQCQWCDDKLTFSRPGLDGAIEVHDDQVVVLARLGFMLTPLQGRLTKEVEQMLREHFPQGPSQTRGQTQG